VIRKLNRILAPFVPFTSEVIYQNLERQFESNSSDSVHLCSWIEAVSANRDLNLEKKMATTRKIVSAARGLRNEGGIRVRQPLPEVVVAGLNSELNSNYIALIKDELNVKSVRHTSDAGELFSYNAKANFKMLGPKVGAGMKEMASSISSLSNEQIADLLTDAEIELNGINISKEDLILTEQPTDGYWVRNIDDITVAVAHTVDSKLRQEWLAREFVHHVQNLRRAANLNVTQRIRITYLSNSEINDAVQQHREYICNETLAVLVAEEDKIEHGKKVVVGKINLTLTISAMNERG
jgi:isoleucyl-tRNA synthetase